MLMEFFIGMRIAEAMSDPERVTLLRRLAAGEVPAETLLEGFPRSREALLSHLSVLVEANLVASRSDGISVLYRIEPSSRGILRNVLENAEVRPNPAAAAQSPSSRGTAPIAGFAV